MTTPALRVPFTRPWMDEREVEAAARAIRSGWVTQGPEVEAFEAEFAGAVGSPHAAAVSSGTAALHLALVALGVGPGDEVVTVSHSFIATANSIRHAGAEPVFVDIVEGTQNIDPEEVARRVSSRTRAILAVHQFGMPCDLASLARIARERGVALVEDAACALGSEIRWDGRWERIGAPHGDVACFSLHPRKVITTGEGGVVTTRDGELDKRIRALRHHGMSISDLERHRSSQALVEAYPTLGFNFRLSDIHAAIGRAQLSRLAEILERRRRLAQRYHEALRDLPGLSCQEESGWARSNWQSYSVRLPGSCDIAAVRQELLDRGIATRPGIPCAHREGAYAERHGHQELPRSQEASRGRLLLPIFPQMDERDQDYVIRCLGDLLKDS